jgi:hypothetical protein
MSEVSSVDGIFADHNGKPLDGIFAHHSRIAFWRGTGKRRSASDAGEDELFLKLKRALDHLKRPLESTEFLQS